MDHGRDSEAFTSMGFVISEIPFSLKDSMEKNTQTAGAKVIY
jgi:hypothetical protein